MPTLNPETIALGVNAFALIWGASKLQSTVETLSKAVSKLEGTMESVGEDLSNHETRITVLEVRGAVK